MHIRRAQPTDFPTTASISVDCFWEDELYDFTNPYKVQYPDHFRSLFLRRHHQRFWTPGFVFYVAVTDEGDDGHEGDGTVVGYAVWCRRGTSEQALKWQTQSVQSCSQRLRYFDFKIRWGTMADLIGYNRYRAHPPVRPGKIHLLHTRR